MSGALRDGAARDGTLHSVAKALEILHLLRAHGPQRLSDIAREVGVGSSTAHRLVTTLRQQRFVRQERNGKRYELGSAMLFSSTVSALEHCVAVSEDVMRELQETTGETIHLTVLRGGRCLFAASVESGRPVSVTSRVGQGPPAHTAAGGKILLAALDPERLTEVYLSAPLPAITADSITEVTELERELDAARDLGFARNLGESEADMYALAVPVRRPSGEVISSLTVAAPLSRMGGPERGVTLNSREEGLLQQVRAAAARIEVLLAY
ncbi:IclR family transcriptional regulator [Leucobacter rhizosphaerae]|uniref:IclR family transcriptional regulator n=1 Tax=Leucobacter rhizosphaerae TaxID=2932245 RepID=A0ABY4FUV2_9MICO|nr:IclR family transcriptional regulator [Leucobacter rhizosphaerae]UOQ60058.1 IclR family transcriptional regulator [Leucobacter rhizosphaerae]